MPEGSEAWLSQVLFVLAVNSGDLLSARTVEFCAATGTLRIQDLLAQDGRQVTLRMAAIKD